MRSDCATAGLGRKRGQRGGDNDNDTRAVVAEHPCILARLPCGTFDTSGGEPAWRGGA